MNHIPSKRLQLLRWIVIAYSLNFIVGYIYAIFTHHGWKGSQVFSIGLVILVIAQLAYEAIATFTILKKSVWVATAITFIFALLETLVVLNATNIDKSPYSIAIVILIFLIGSLGKYCAPIVAFIIGAGYLLGLAGQSGSSNNTKYGIIFVWLNAISAALSYFIWGKFFEAEEDPQLKSLAIKLSGDQQQSEIIIESIGDGVIVVNNEGNISMINPAAAKLTEWEVKDALGIDYRSVVQLSLEDGKPIDDNSNLFSEALHDKKSAIKSLLLVGRNKKQTVVSIVVSPILVQPDNQVLGAVAVFHDITEQRKAEHQRADFISTASHEMRTPVAAIEGYLSLAMNSQVSNIDTKARDFLEKAHQSTKQLGKLFQDLLTSSRAEDGRLVNHPKVVDMGQFIQGLAESFQLAGQKKHLIVDFTLINESNTGSEISGKIITPLYYVQVDPDRIGEVVTNLFDNAVKYTQAGKITVGIGGDANNVQVFIQDTGAGISAEDIPHLFQKFYRVDNSSVRTIGGTGLGLFICKKIVELYGGRIWVESELGKGSIFRFNLPRLNTQQAEALIRSESIQDQIAMPPSNVTL